SDLPVFFVFFFQAEDGIRDGHVTGVQTCALPIYDVAIHRKVGERVAEIAYALEDEVLGGSVRCDGLVVATPAGSTGYNLANGGQIGRASCRERVESSVARGSGTDKKK